MAKKLIVLYGKENTGKTETLNRLIKILLLAEGKIIRAETHTSKPEAIDIKISGDKTQVLIPQNIEDFHNTFWDKKVVIGYREKRIAIATKGDYERHPKENIKFFENQAGDILVTAIRDIQEEKGRKMKEYIEKKFEENGIIYIDKSKCKDNQTQAEEIKAFIDEICNESEKENSSQE